MNSMHKASICKRMKRLVCCLLTALICLQGIVLAGAEGDTITDPDEKAAWVVAAYTDSSMTQEEKALILHDWLILNAYYDYTFAAPDRFEAAGVLINGTGVCDSYAKAYILLLSKAGIEAKRVSGTVPRGDGTLESHAWNLVQMDGKWYQVDVTWDDPIDPANPTAKVSGLEHRLYFKASRRFMSEEHIPDAESAELIDTLVGDDEYQDLPESVDISADHALTEMHLIRPGNRALTEAQCLGKTMILVYGRTTCGNTRAFLSDISPYIELLTRRGIQVLVALFDDPGDDEMLSFENDYPGIVCAKMTDEDYSLWIALQDFGYQDNTVTFPIVFLKNQRNRLTYYSTSYVEEPLRILSGVLKMQKEETGTVILPADLTVIEEYAFSGVSFISVILGDKTKKICGYAFANNLQLERIYIPASVTSISETAFSGCPGGLIIAGQRGSAAETFAKAHGYTFEAE